MSDIPTTAAADPIKRYAPPNQRNRSLSRHKSGDSLDRTSSPYWNTGDNNQVALRNIPILNHKNVESRNLSNENQFPGLIALEGCRNGQASRLFRDRWQAVMHCYNNPSVDLSERPVMYLATDASAWGHLRLPHQLMGSPIGSRSQMNFLNELQRAIHNAKC